MSRGPGGFPILRPSTLTLLRPDGVSLAIQDYIIPDYPTVVVAPQAGTGNRSGGSVTLTVIEGTGLPVQAGQGNRSRGVVTLRVRSIGERAGKAILSLRTVEVNVRTRTRLQCATV